jgi:mannose-6-phosphate isomerase-like protein (cupin superfamily)
MTPRQGAMRRHAPVSVLLSPGRTSGLRLLTCERVALVPGAQPARLDLSGEEQVGYVAAGHGLLTTAGGEGHWVYPVEQGTAFWLGAGIACSLACTGEAPLIVARFRYPERDAPPGVGLRRRIVTASKTPSEVEVGRRVRVLFRGTALGSGVLVTVEESTYGPGGASPLHRAVGMEEVFYVVCGRGRVTRDREIVPVQPGDAVAIPSGVFHNVTAERNTLLRHVTCNILV